MGGQQDKAPPPPPPKTIKEMAKEFSRSINKLRRDFGREITKLEFNTKKIKNEMQQMIKKKEQRAAIRLHAQQLLKQEQFIRKYQRLDAQLGDVLFQVNSAATTDTLVNIMKGMGDIMKKQNEALDVKNIQMALETFNMEVEKQNIMQEQIQDIMSNDEEEIGDEEADKVIMQMENSMGGNGGGQGQLINKPDEGQLNNNFEDRLNALK